MPNREAILAPLAGDNPAGQDLRYAPIYDQIKEARREDDDLPQGAWAHERKVADYPRVIILTEQALCEQSKDLQLAAWMTEALLKERSFAGFNEGLEICDGLLNGFWDNLYPLIDDGDLEFRAAPLDWIGRTFDGRVRSAPICAAGHSYYGYKESRSIEYEEQAKEKDKKTARDAALKAGKLAPEAFDRAFGETPKAFYAATEAALDSCIRALAALSVTSGRLFADAAPSFGKVQSALTEVRQVVHALLTKKRELEPDPVVEEAPPPVESTATDGAVAEAGGAGAAVVSRAVAIAIEAPEEPADRKESIANIVAAAAFLRRREPRSPAPYLMLRGLRWGELRAAVAGQDFGKLEAPPTDLRRLLKRMSIESKWKDLIETAEHAMGLPCSRAWLDLQRMVVQACNGLGDDYSLIALAIQSELRALVRDIPQLLELSLTDDTPAANGETKAWLDSLVSEPQSASPKLPGAGFELNGHTPGAWQQKFVDSFEFAREALRAGQEQKAFEILQAEIQSQQSGRGRFERRLQLVQLCVSTGKEALMQPILDDLLAAVENHKLEEWEDREKLAAGLATILRASKKIQADAKEKQKLFERICRLDPVQALSVG